MDQIMKLRDLGSRFGNLRTGTSNYFDDSGLFNQNGIIGQAIKIYCTQNVCTIIYSSTEVMNRNIQVTINYKPLFFILLEAPFI